MHIEASDAPTVLANGGSDDGVIIIGDKRYRTSQGLAKLYQVSPRTIVRWKPPTILLGKLRLTDEDDLLQWMAGRKIGGGDAKIVRLIRWDPRAGETRGNRKT